jgi:hypothetical protein
MAAYANIGQPTGSQLPDDLRNYFLQFGDPGAGFWNYLGQNRVGNIGSARGMYNLQGNDPFSKFAQSNFDKYQSEWQAASADNPGLGFYDFLQTKNPEQEYSQLAPSQQGFFSNVITPRARMVLR